MNIEMITMLDEVRRGTGDYQDEVFDANIALAIIRWMGS
jgi:hypothetical protein